MEKRSENKNEYSEAAKRMHPVDGILILLATTLCMRGLRILVNKGLFPLHAIAALLPGGATVINIQFVAQIIQSSIMIGLVFFVLTRFRGGNIRDLGFGTYKDNKWVLWAVLMGFGAFLLMLAMTATIARFWPQLIHEQDVMSIVTQAKSDWELLAVVLMVGVMAPVAEEILFRGYLYHSAEPRFGRVWAIVITSLVFGCMHTDLFRVLQLSMIGAYLNGVMLKADSLWASIFAHSVWNLAMVYLALML